MQCSLRRGGMTPTETLLLAAVFAGAALFVFYTFHNSSGEDARVTTVENMNEVMEALRNYAIDNGADFPTTDQGLKALLARPADEPVPRNWRGPYLENPEAIYDGWGMPLHYISPGGKHPDYDLWSNGADNREGGRGADADILSWDLATMSP